MDKIRYHIYILKHPITNEIRYVGQTKNTLSNRLYDHLYEARKRKNLTYKNNWVFSLLQKELKPKIEMLDYAWGIEEANQIEKTYIKRFKEMGKRLTNSTTGGEGHVPIPLTEEQKDKYRKQVIELNTGKIYKSQTHAAKELGVLPSSISAICKGKHASIHGYRFQYGNTPVDYKNPHKALKRPIIEVKSGIKYNNTKEAAETLKLDKSHISAVLRGDRIQTGGCQFKYADDSSVFVLRNRKFNNKKIIETTTNTIYNSIKEAALKNNLKPCSLSQAINGKIKKLRCGLVFKFLIETQPNRNI